MSQISGNDEGPSRYFGDSSQLNNWILDSGEKCHVTPKVSDFIPGLLEHTDKHIEVSDRYQVTENQKGKVQIKMCGDNGYTFIATLHSVILAPDIWDRFFSITTLMNLGHTCLFQKWVLYGVLQQQGEDFG